jgi:hypothetical protein
VKRKAVIASGLLYGHGQRGKSNDADVKAAQLGHGSELEASMSGHRIL